MSNVIPKEKQTAYQRWELTSFGEARLSQHEKQQPEPPRLTQEEIDAIKEKARQEAYAEGYKEAYETGFIEGRDAGYQEMQEQAKLMLEHLEELTKEFKSQLDSSSESIGADLIQLAVSIASKMTKRQFEVAPDTLIDIIHEAINLLPSISQPASIYLHPDDRELVKELIGDRLETQGWRLQDDHQLSRAGCRIETAQNTIDATYESRWKSLTDRLIGLPIQETL
ncbi:flagellar assembly protein FliH [Undibacterium cyanobacteriorum]|uniref:Flagellar assembly protein FliH n=1 Tax=Undibacterium cyanobacteriorum TaxID=3073561 RepID=A0ABY9RLX7_9BURK|nr:flagellar assembly protein FliH [Undibacterium sp. 20NA77.5]WMW82217.1 flagellar assembly protein FliH [Undibacterium sp. 20NA77.5]